MNTELPFVKISTYSNNTTAANKMFTHYAKVLRIAHGEDGSNAFKELLAGLATQKPKWKLERVRVVRVR